MSDVKTQPVKINKAAERRAKEAAAIERCDEWAQEAERRDMGGRN